MVKEIRLWQMVPVGLALLILGLPLNLFTQEPDGLTSHHIPVAQQLISTVAFGSCNMESKPQEMWRWVAANKPDLWVWLGDIVYGDTRDMGVLEEKYDLRKNHPVYQLFIKQFPVIGIWDDHDYGENDAGISYPMKKQSRNLLFQFLDIAPTLQQEGAYQSYVFGPSGKKIKFILLDCRYFREDPTVPLCPSDEDGQKELDILGEKQWEWLEMQLCQSEADVHVIGSGIQVLADEHRFEKWSNFPFAKRRLYELLVKCDPKRTVFLSGDRHMAEISAMALDDFGHIIDFTSSGMTHTRASSDAGPNRFRIGQAVNDKNFGLLHFYWDERPLKMAMEIRGLENALFQRVDVRFPE